MKGASFDYRFQWLNDNGITTTPQNLTGFTGRCALKSIQGETTYLTLTSENEGIVFGGESGLIDIKISAATTEAITWSAAAYTLFVLNPNSNETLALLTGRFITVAPF